MTSPSPFSIGYNLAGGAANTVGRLKDESSLDSILEEAMKTEDPRLLQEGIGQLIQQVSPERRQEAVSFLQNKMTNIEKKAALKKQNEAALRAGVDPDLPESLQKILLEERSADERASKIMNWSPNNQDIGQDQLIQEGTQTASVPSPQPGQGLNQPQKQTGIRGLSDDQLIAWSGVKGYSEPAKQELRRRQEEAKSSKSNFEPESEKLEAKRVSELATEIENEYSAAKNEDLRLERQLKIDEKGNVSTPALLKVMDAIGIPIGVLSNPDTEEYRKLEADFLRDVNKVFPGGKITNYEIQSYLKTIPSLMNSPEGRKSIIRNRKLMNEAKKVRYNEYKKIIKENNGKKPQNLAILLEERTQERISDIEDRFINGVESGIEKFQQPIRMIDPQGNPVDIPPNMIERALQSGAKFK